MWHVEQLMDALTAHMKNSLSFGPSLADVLAETDTTLQAWPPRAEDYFLGAPGRYRGYRAPSVFFSADRVRRPLAGSSGDYGHTLYQEHGVSVAIVVEESREERLERLCDRIGEVLDAVLHDQELYLPDVNTRTCKVFVPAIVNGGSWVVDRDQRAFRQDVRAECLIRQWE